MMPDPRTGLMAAASHSTRCVVVDFGIDNKLVWDAVKTDIPDLKPKLEKILTSLWDTGKDSELDPARLKIRLFLGFLEKRPFVLRMRRRMRRADRRKDYK